ncbi:MAG: lipid A deacylase LpxR family protein, partial [Proteobacteria bacterium]|nr:lipid A deacylase LpxR family protein [Pseudomonadota bacterium]
MRTAAILLGLVAWPLAITAAAAQAPKDTYSVQWENDRFSKTDRHYTNGFRLSWVSGARDGDPAWVKDVLEMLYPFASLRQGRVGAALGQSMFTPEDKTTTALVPTDRPYAGWLYGAISVHAETRRVVPANPSAPAAGTNMLDTVELNIGVVGPWSLARQAQDKFHDL